VLDTLVGNEYIRGVSGGERKRISIVESLAANSSVVAWDNSTRGLDAASALDYARSLRIITNTCGKATIVSLYQVSDSVYNLTDKVLLIDQGRMIFQGPAHLAKSYFESLGYECQERQTISDFLTSVTSATERRFKPGWIGRTPKGAIELENAFHNSVYYDRVQKEILEYQAGLSGPVLGSSGSSTCDPQNRLFKNAVRASKSRYVPQTSSYTISFLRQIYLCAKRQWWQLKGHPLPFYIKTFSTVVNSFLIGSVSSHLIFPQGAAANKYFYLFCLPCKFSLVKRLTIFLDVLCTARNVQRSILERGIYLLFRCSLRLDSACRTRRCIPWAYYRQQTKAFCICNTKCG